MRTFLSALLLLLFPIAAEAVAPAFAPVYTWKQNPGRKDQLDLLRNGSWIGSYFAGEDNYYFTDGRVWGPVVKPPIPLPGEFRIEEGPIENHGIDLEGLASCPKRRAEGHFLTVGGRTREISIAETKDLIEKGLPDDREKPWFVAPGFSAEQEKKIVADFGASPYAATHRLWAGPADHFHMRDSADKSKPLGYEAGRIHLVQADGELVAWKKGFAGPGDFEKLEAIRRPKPINPDKVPDPDKAKPSPLIGPGNPKDWSPATWACGGLCALVVLRLIQQANKPKEG